MKRNLALLAGMIIILSGCSWPFGGAIQTVAFTVLETPGGGLDALIPQAKIVNIGEQAVDILITGEALKNGAYPLFVNKVRADHKEIQIFLDWDKSKDAVSQPVHNLIRLEKGDWWSSKKPPKIRLMNVNGGKLNAESKSRDVRKAVFDRLPELTDEKIFLKFSLEDIDNTRSQGVWEATVVGVPKDGDDTVDIVAKLRIDDRDLNKISGKITYHFVSNGAIMKVEELD